jgi:hypothetical protein
MMASFSETVSESDSQNNSNVILTLSLGNILKNTFRQCFIHFIRGLDRLLASPATTLLSDFVPGIFRCAATTANKLQRAS